MGNKGEDLELSLLGGSSNGSDAYVAMEGSSASAASIAAAGAARSKNDLGTFIGVFVPCTLSMMGGVIIFVRLGWFVAESGLLEVLSMVALAFFLLGATGISICAIATNGVVKGGGPYYMISRTLGPEFGGSMGLVFYIANVLSVAQAIVGFGSTVGETYNLGTWSQFGIELVLLAVLIALCIGGASIFARASSTFLVGLIASLFICLISFLFQSEGAAGGYTGPSGSVLSNNLLPQYVFSLGDNQSYQSVFGVLFSSVTGVMAGANMSGDLKDPAVAIPRGTIYSLAFTCISYTALIVVQAASVTRDALLNNTQIMQSVCFWSPIYVVGFYIAIFSSAVPGISGSARILQALARDNLIPYLGVFGYGSPKGDEPRNAVILTCILIVVFLLIGNLNVIATFSGMAFLACYAIVNLACFVLAAVGAQNFRPRFKFFSRYLALVGCIGCLVMMFLIQWIFAILAVAFMAIIFFLILYRAPDVSWGDISQAVFFHSIRRQLLSFDTKKEHVKFWRPQILFMVDDFNNRSNQDCAQAVNDIKKGGLFVLGHVVLHSGVKDDEKSLVNAAAAIDRAQADLHGVCKRGHYKAFVQVVASASFREGVTSMAMATGLSNMRPNTLSFKLPSLSSSSSSSNPSLSARSPAVQPLEFIKTLIDLKSLNKNILLCRNFESFHPPNPRGSASSSLFSFLSKDSVDSKVAVASPGKVIIDIWLGVQNPNYEEDASTSLAVVLAWSLSRSKQWRKGSYIRAVSFVDATANLEYERTRVADFMARARVTAVPLVVPVSRQLAPAGFSGLGEASARFAAINYAYLPNKHGVGIILTPSHAPFYTQENPTQFIEECIALTDGLPSVALCYAQKTVITTDL